MSARPTRLVLIGTVLVDIAMALDRLPERGGDLLASGGRVSTGAGYNVLVGCVRQGLPAAYAGRVGCGPFGQMVVHDLAVSGIEIMVPEPAGEDTGFCVAMVEPDGERTFVTVSGCEAKLLPGDLNGLRLGTGDVVYVSGYDLAYPVSGASVARWVPTVSPDNLVVFDPGPLVAEIAPERIKPILARTDIITLNAREARLLTSLREPAHAAEALLARLAPGGRAVVRDGAMGCWVATTGADAVHVDGHPVHAVDSTGAGDAHVAAMVAALGRDEELVAAAAAANVVAALAVTEYGPATTPTLAEVDAHLAAMPVPHA